MMRTLILPLVWVCLSLGLLLPAQAQVTLPFMEDFESVGPDTTFTTNTPILNGLTGANHAWSYEKTLEGRLRTRAWQDWGSSTPFTTSGNHAITLDDTLNGGATSINYLILTIDMSSYLGSQVVEMDFNYANHGEESHTNDRVFVRGSALDTWIVLYDLNANQPLVGAWKNVKGVDVDSALALNSQAFSLTTQFRFGQEDNFGADNPTSSDGYSFDDVSLYRLSDVSAAALAVTSPASGCGLGMDTVCVNYSNIGGMAFDSTMVFYSINGGTPVSGMDTTNLNPGDQTTYCFPTLGNFSTVGNYTVQVWVQAAGDTLPADDTTTFVVTHAQTVSTFPYLEDFELGSGGWVSGGTSSTWALATPANATINAAASGANAWITNPTGSYSSNEDSYVQSPCMDFSTILNPIISFNVWWNSESGWDGAALQSSIDGGLTWQLVGTNGGALGNPANWYNDGSINSNPGGQGIGWSGRFGSGSNGYLAAQHDLTGLGGQISVLLRVAFSSDGSGQDDGFAFDDVLIYETPASDASAIAITSPASGSGCGLGMEMVSFAYYNTGTGAFDSAMLSFQVDGGIVTTEIDTTNLPSGDSTVYTFTALAGLSSPGLHTILAWVKSPNDILPFQDTLFINIFNTQVVSTFPYIEDFESGPGDWTTDGNGSWELGLPRGGTIDTAASGFKAWMTDTLNSYANNECSFVLSPCFDFSTMLAPVVRANIWVNSEDSWDGTSLQATIDSGKTWVTIGSVGSSTNNWYNDAGIGGLNSCLSNGEGWTDDIMTGYVVAEHQVPIFGGEPNVIFRFAFGSDGSGNTSWDGFAFDDFEIFEAPPVDAQIIAIGSPVTDCSIGMDTVCFSYFNNGSITFDSISVSYQINGGTVVTERDTATLQPGDSATFCFTTIGNFTALGSYTINAWVSVTGDNININDSTVSTIINIPTISTFPYVQGFENGPEGWTSGGSNSTWQLGQPVGAVINSAASGNYAWVTDSVGSYSTNEDSYVQSPCLDFTGIQNPRICFSTWWNSEFSWDGAALQSSIDNGLTWQLVGTFNGLVGDPVNWYTDNSINGGPGGQQIGWSGRNSSANGSNGYVQAQHDLTGLGGLSKVQLRVAFGSDGSVQDDGFAFDDVLIFDKNISDASAIAIISPASGCGLAMETVTFAYYNTGIGAFDSARLAFQINGGTIVSEIDTTTLQPGDSTVFTFTGLADLSALGTYIIKVWTSAPNDVLPFKDTLSINVTNIFSVSTFPYLQDFEAGPGDWTAGGTSSSWALATPANAVINTAASGTNAWITNPTGAYNANENSYVQSPCFDFTGLQNPRICLNAWWNSEFSSDGTALQSSIDGGMTWQLVGTSNGFLGNPINWYNDNSLSGNPGGQPIGWTGRNSSGNGSNGYVLTQHDLIGLAGLSQVQFRVVFGSNGFTQDDGFSFDDVLIFDKSLSDASALTILSPISNCGLGMETVSFAYNNSGGGAFDSANLSFQVNGGVITTEIDTSTIQPGATTVYTFTGLADVSTPGLNTITVWVKAPNDGLPFKDTLSIQVYNTEIVNTFPYLEDFESGPADWTTDGSGSWELGLPRGTTIDTAASGFKAWMTDTVDIYPNSACSFVLSPCFDFSTMIAPVVRANIWVNSEDSWDGTSLQATIDSGLTWFTVGSVGSSPNNWYNDAGVNGLNACINNGAGWTDDVMTGYVAAEHLLPTFAGEPNVRFRFVFGSDGSFNTWDGFAFDDFEIFEQPPIDGKMIAIESPFTNCSMGMDSICISYMNNGAVPMDSVSLSYQINGGTVIAERDTVTLQPGDTATYCFTALGNFTVLGSYIIDSWVSVSGDNSLANDSATTTVTHLPSVSTFPYDEDFENGPAGWTSGGINNSWQLGQPVGTVISSASSGSYAWVTDTAGTYNSNESSFVISPCFDLSTVFLPILEASIWWDSENGWDGTVLQSTIDGGQTWTNVGSFGDPDWYNDLTINGNPGDQSIGWANVAGGSGGWRNGAQILRTLGGQPAVRFRFAFGSDASFNLEGFAFDKFGIRETPSVDAQVLDPLSPASACGLGMEQVGFSYINGGLAAFDSAQVSYSINGGTPIVELDLRSVNAGDTVIYPFTALANFSTPGTYNITIVVNPPGDMVNQNDTLRFTVTNVPNISTFPHLEDFESGPGGWSAGGNGNWQWGLPQGGTIDTAASGVKAWMTDTLNNYINNECSFVLSPCFDFSTLNLPLVRASIWASSENSWDGTSLQATTDSGLTWITIGNVNDPINWYNTTAAGLNTCTGSNAAWGGTGMTNWITAEHELAFLAGEPDVRFRFFFGSDVSFNEDGFAFDDFQIEDVPPNDIGVVLLLTPNQGACGDSNTVVSVVVKNFGSLEQAGYPIIVTITDTPNVFIATLNTVSPDTLFPGQSDTVIVGIINTYAGGQFTFVNYTNLANDTDRTNDTLRTVINITPIPPAPFAMNQSSCAADSFTLRVQNPDTLLTYAWFDTVGNAPLALGDSFITPLLAQTQNYFLGTFVNANDSISTTFAAGNGSDGNMFDLTNVSGFAWTIDSVAHHISTTLQRTVEVLYVTNRTTYVGKQTDATQWTSMGTAVVTGQGTGTPTFVPVGGLTVFPGETIGMYVHNSGAGSTAYTNGSNIYNNGDLEINTGLGLGGVFGNVIGAPRTWNGTIFYSGAGCPSELATVTAAITPISPPNLGPDRAVCSGTVVDGTTVGATSYVWSTTATTASINVSLTGQYALTITNIDGCVGADTINLLVQPLPTVDLGLADTSGCGSLLLDAGNPGSSYAWSSGGLNQTDLVTTNGTYSVNVTNASGCSATDTINVTILPVPSVNLGPDITECEDAILDAGVFPANYTYLWSTTDVTQTITVNTTGLYSVTVTDTAGCDATDDLVVSILPAAVVDLGLDRTECDSVILDAGIFNTYTWNNMAMGQTIVVKSDGTYYVDVLDNNGCTGTDTVSIMIAESPVATWSSIFTSATDVTFTNNSTPSGAGVTYLWVFGDGNTSTMENPTHSYGIAGNYIVRLTVTTPNCGDDESEVTIGTDLEDDLFDRSITLFPNPSNGIFALGISGLQVNELHITVSDVTGKTIMEFHENQRVNGNFEHVIDLTGHAEGVYMVTVFDGQRFARKKMVVR